MGVFLPKNWVKTRRITRRVSSGDRILHAIPKTVRLYFFLKSRFTNSSNRNWYFFIRSSNPHLSLLLLIHLLVIPLVGSAGDPLHPARVVQVPPDGLLDALLKGVGRGPAKFSGDLGVINGVPPVVAGAVLDVGDEALRLAQGLQDQTDDLDVGLLVVAADVVDLACFPLLQHRGDGGAVVLYMEPVPYLHPVAVDRQGLVLPGVVYHQGDEFFRELVGAVVVGAAGDIHRKPVGLVIGPDDEVGAGLGGGIGAVGGQGRRLGEHPGFSQCAVDLVGGDLEVSHAGAVLPGVLVVRVQVPVALGGVQEGLGADDVGGEKHLRLQDAAVHVALRREVDHGIKVVFGEQLFHQGFITDVALHEAVTGVILDRLQVLQVPGVGQQVEIKQQDEVLLLIQYILDKI